MTMMFLFSYVTQNKGIDENQASKAYDQLQARAPWWSDARILLSHC